MRIRTVKLTWILSMAVLSTAGYASASTKLLASIITAERSKTHENLSSTHSLHFAVESVLPAVPHQHLLRTAELLHANNPTSSVMSIMEELEVSHGISHDFKRLHYAIVPECEIWEYSRSANSVPGLSSALLDLTLADCKTTTDGKAFWSEVQWSDKLIRIRDGSRQSPPKCLSFGLLARDTLETYSAIQENGLSAGDTLSVEEDEFSQTLILQRLIKYWNYSTATTDTTTLVIRTSYSKDGNMDLLREEQFVNGIRLRNVAFSEYAFNSDLDRRYPLRTQEEFASGPVIVHRVITPFSWQYDVSVWDLGLYHAYDLINVYYILLRNGFSIFKSGDVSLPAGVSHWVQ